MPGMMLLNNSNPSIPKCFWMISAPKTREDTFNTLNKQIGEENDFSTNYRFQVPDLKVGTLDSLMSLSDELHKIDAFVEQAARKVAAMLFDVLEDPNEAAQQKASNVNPQKKDPKMESLTINNNNVDTYITFFRWDEAKYPTNQHLKLLVDTIQAQVGKLDDELKIKGGEYNALVYAISAEERKVGGNFLIRDLSDVVKPNHVISTEYLTTLFVAVPRMFEKEWLAQYEKITDFVLPRCGQLIDSDNDYLLYRVVLFKRVAEDFKNLAKEKKFVVRDFVFDANKSAMGDKKKLEKERDALRKTLVRWCKTNFAEAFIAWIHLKAIRVFVESVLRYGLPTNFQAMLLLPHKNKTSKLRKALQDLYGHLSSQAAFKATDDIEEDEEHALDEKFFPYVFMEINADMRPKLAF